MIPENMPAPPSTGATPAIRPPDFFLPKTDLTTPGRRTGEPDVYVSWGGQIYGPSAVDHVVSGVRTSYFGDDALFWFEGRDGWSPIDELRALFQKEAAIALPGATVLHLPPAKGIRPRMPGRKSTSTAGAQPERRRRRKSGRKNRPNGPGRSILSGKLIVFGAILLAVLITAGMLLLLSLT